MKTPQAQRLPVKRKENRLMTENEKIFVKAGYDESGMVRVTMNGRTFDVVRLMSAMAKRFFSDPYFSDEQARSMYKDLIDDICYGVLDRRGEGWRQAVTYEMKRKPDPDIGKAN